LIVDALAEQEKIEIDEEALGNKVAEIVTASGRNRDKAAEFYRKPENIEGLRQTMRREKALDLILERAKRDDTPTSDADASVQQTAAPAESAEAPAQSTDAPDVASSDAPVKDREEPT
jgi:FKBP-type peptidyl-prolyl cis-trans isomerase (trigger factor)